MMIGVAVEGLLMPTPPQSFSVLICVLLLGGNAFAADCNHNGVEDALDTVKPQYGFGTADQYVLSDQRGLRGPGSLILADFNNDERLDVSWLTPGAPGTEARVSVLIADVERRFREVATYRVGTEPRALIAANLNGDESRDLAVANADSNTVTVLINERDGVFTNAEEYTVGAAPALLLADDLDVDGTPDLITGNKSSRDVSIILRGAAKKPTGQYSVGKFPISLIAMDLNADRLPDLALGTSPGQVSVLLNIGAGQLGAVAHYAVGSFPQGLLSVDVNMDERPDLAAAIPASNEIHVLLNLGDGTFSTLQAYSVGLNPQALTTADYNRDGKPDLVCANVDSENLTLLTNSGNGTFLDIVHLKAGIRPRLLKSDDLNGDGNPDLAVANSGPFTFECNAEQGTISVLLNNGGGGFRETIDYPVETEALTLLSGDVDGNGQPDLITSDENFYYIYVLFNGGNGTWESPTRYDPLSEAVSGIGSLATGDFNQDGKTDLATVNTHSDNVTILMNDGNGVYPNPVSRPVGLEPHALVVADLDGNSAPDLAVANHRSETVAILFNQSNGVMWDTHTYLVGAGPTALVAADFNLDGQSDLAATGCGSADVAVLISENGGMFNEIARYAAPPGTKSLAVADFDNDTSPDIAVMSEGESNILSILLNNRVGRFGEAGSHRFPDEGYRFLLRVVELNGDGADDLVVGHWWSDFAILYILLNKGDGGFDAPSQIFGASVLYSDITVADFDDNGMMDIATVAGNEIDVLLGRGGSVFDDYGYTIGELSASSNMVVADFNGDDTPDLSVADPKELWVLLNENGRFVRRDRYRVGDRPNSLIAIDADADGKADLATTNAESNDVSVLLNHTAPAFSLDLNHNGIPDECDPGAFRRGDANTDGKADVTDAVFILDYLFRGGREPPCMNAADVDSDGTVNLTDPIFALNFLFRGGPPPDPPGPSTFCGLTPVTTIDLGCLVYNACE